MENNIRATEGGNKGKFGWVGFVVSESKQSMQDWGETALVVELVTLTGVDFDRLTM